MKKAQPETLIAPGELGRLMAEGITDIRHLRDEQGLPTLCQHQAMRATPYLISVDLA